MIGCTDKYGRSVLSMKGVSNLGHVITVFRVSLTFPVDESVLRKEESVHEGCTDLGKK